MLKTPRRCFPGKKNEKCQRLFFLIKIYISAFWGYQTAGWETREKRREVRAKFNGASFRRLYSKRRCAFRIGVFCQTAGMRAPEWPAFFVVSNINTKFNVKKEYLFLIKKEYLLSITDDPGQQLN